MAWEENSCICLNMQLIAILSRIGVKLDRYNELKDVVRLMSRAVGLQDKVTTDEYSGLFNVISDYVYALDTLDQYDYQSLSISKTTKEEPFRATYDNAMEAINALKEKFGGSKWFANIAVR